MFNEKLKSNILNNRVSVIMDILKTYKNMVDFSVLTEVNKRASRSLEGNVIWRFDRLNMINQKVTYFMNNRGGDKNTFKLINEDSLDGIEDMVDDIILNNRRQNLKLHLVESENFNEEDESSVTLHIKIKFKKIPIL